MKREDFTFWTLVVSLILNVGLIAVLDDYRRCESFFRETIERQQETIEQQRDWLYFAAECRV